MNDQPQITQEQYDALNARLVELETHTHSGVDSLQVSETDLSNRTRHIQYRALAPATANTVAVVGGVFSCPFSGNFTVAGATVDTAGTTGSETVDILKNGVSIMTNTKINIASGATDSRGSAPCVFTTGFFMLGDLLTFSVTAVQGTPALGLTVFIRCTQTSK